MRRKAKELQQARRDAERSGKKVPAFGGFGSAGMTSVSSGSIITDTIVEPEKPKITPAPVRYNSEKYMSYRGLLLLFIFASHCSFEWQRSEFDVLYTSWGQLMTHGVVFCLFFSFPDQVDPVRLWNWVLKEKRWTTLLTSSSLRVKPSCLPQEREALMYLKFCHHQSMWRGTDTFE